MRAIKSIAFSVTLAVILVTVGAKKQVANIRECPTICPSLWAPVCGTDGTKYQQFDNSCEMKVKNCKLTERFLTPFTETDLDWCTSTFVDQLLDKYDQLNWEKSSCLKPCPMIYQPICVSDGKYRGLIPNPCVLEMVNCALGELGADTPLFRVLKEQSC